MFKIYRSGAGSGKTFTLVKNYLKHLLKPYDPAVFKPDYYKYILAITFTNDATKEMKQRILKEIEHLAHLKSQTNDMLKAILADFQKDNSDQPINRNILIQQAKRIHRSLLHNYSNFNIQTIDAFNSQIIRTFHKDLGLPYNYELIIHQEELVEQTVKSLLEEGKQKEQVLLRKYLIDFSHIKLEDGKNWHLSTDLERFTLNLFSETKASFIKILKHQPLYEFQNTQKAIRIFLDNFEKYIRSSGQRALDLIKQAGLSHQDLYYGLKGIYGYFSKQTQLKQLGLAKLEPNTYVLKTIEENKWASTTKNPHVDTIKDDLSKIYETIEDFKKEHEEVFFIGTALQKTIYTMGLSGRIAHHLELVKAKNNWLAISDFNPILEEIINTSPTAYVYERIGEKYNHLMIDEFQDTSSIQWHNILPLLLHTLSQGFNSMVVGDCKQAIYRWRGGDAITLANLPQIKTISQASPIYSDTLALANNTRAEQLNYNYRSAKILVGFNNDFFQYLFESQRKTYLTLHNYYQNVHQECQKTNLKGSVDLIFIEPHQPKAAYESASVEKIIALIQRARQQGFHQKDIAILTRNNKELKYIAQALTQAKIAIISDESLLISVASCVKLIIQTLELFHYQSSHYQYNFLITFITYCKNYQALNIADLTGEDWEILKDRLAQNKLSIFLDWFNQYYNLSLLESNTTGFSLYELIVHITCLFKMHRITQEAVYMDKFLEIVADFSNTRSNLRAEFLKYWKKNKEKLAISALEEVDAVRLMTIHKSKGLEFEMVILGFANWSLEPSRHDKLWQVVTQNPFNKLDQQVLILPFKKELEKTCFKAAYLSAREKIFVDAINILYVALTRAKRQLYILTKAKGEMLAVQKPKYVEDLFYNWLDNIKIDYTQVAEHLNSKQYHFELDDPNWQFPAEHDQHHSKSITLNKSIEKPLRQAMTIIHRDLDQNDKYELNDYIHSPQKYGVLIHKALENIHYYEDIELVLYNLKTRGLLIDENYQALCERLHKLLSSSELKPYYEKTNGFKILNEKAIYIKESDRILRPDRIVLKGQQAVIIDYKTGQRNSKDLQQLKMYKSLIQHMGYTTKAYLIYINLALDSDLIMLC